MSDSKAIKNKISTHKFDTKAYNFQEMVEDLFNCGNLEDIHNVRKDLIPSKEDLSKPWPLNEGKSKFDDTFYR